MPNPETSTISGVCAFLLLAAFIALGTVGVGMATAASLGLPAAAILVAAALPVAGGLALLSGWIWKCRDCRAIRYLQRYFSVLGVALFVLVPVLLAVGQFGPAVGAGLNVVLFGLIVGVLTVGAKRLDCPNPPQDGTR